MYLSGFAVESAVQVPIHNFLLIAVCQFQNNRSLVTIKLFGWMNFLKTIGVNDLHWIAGQVTGTSC